jgi:transcriptional regulator with XRE-family HTH domain
MSRPIALPSPWRELATSLGSVEALAERCGVTPRTVQRWARGELSPGVLVRDAVNGLARRRKLAEPWPAPGGS